MIVIMTLFNTHTYKMTLWLLGTLTLFSTWIASTAYSGQRSPAIQVLEHVLLLCDQAESKLEEAIAAGEMLAKRHLAGGAIGAWWQNGCLGPELYGRSGNFVNIGFDRIWTNHRTKDEKSMDTALIGMEWPPWTTERKLLENEARQATMVIGFGPKKHPDIEEFLNSFNIFFDTGFGADDRVADIGNNRKAGHLNHVANALHAWMVMAETTAALTRQGKMPVMWKSYSYDDGREWGERYLRKQQFHQHIQVPPQSSETLSIAYFNHIRKLIRLLLQEESEHFQKAARWIAKEFSLGRSTVVAWAGHMPGAYVGRLEDHRWAHPVQLHLFLRGQRQAFLNETEKGALVVRLGQQGFNPKGRDIFGQNGNRVIHMAGGHPSPDWSMPDDALVTIDLKWEFGDACVPIEGYPFPVFPPSGIMQAAAYAALCAEVEQYLDPP